MESHLDECPICLAVVSSLTPAEPPLLKEAARCPAPLVSAEDWCQRLWSAMGADGLANTLTWPPQSGESSTPAEGGLLPFERKGEYQSLGEIGRGGMGIVYRARQIRVGREVAVKMLPSRTCHAPDAVARFKAEVQRLGELDHPNIVHVYDADEQDGVPYFSMELVKGQTLAERNPRAPFGLRQAAELVRVIAGAVHYAHEAGVIHRDLKPGNILLTADYIPKITDYGLAITLDPAAAQSGREIAGTAEYMAPEQWVGAPENIGRRTDVYGIGAILYELLVGRPPLTRSANRNETQRRVLFDRPVPPRQIRERIPRDLEAICLRCLQKSPQDRYATARELADDLQRFRDGYPVRARPVNRFTRGWYCVCRNKVLTAISVVGMLTLAASLAQGWSLRRQGLISNATAMFEAAQQEAADGQVNEGLSRMRSAINLLPAGEATLRRYYRRSVAAWEARRIRPVAARRHSAVVTAAAVSPDGRTLLIGDAAGATSLWNLAEDTVRVLSTGEHRGQVQVAAFNRTGTLGASGDESSVVTVWDVWSGAQVSESHLDGRVVRSLAFLGDGGRFATGTGDPTTPLRLWEAGQGTARSFLLEASNLGVVSRITSSSDGATLIAITAPGGCRLWDSRTGRQLADLAGQAGYPVSAAAFSADGSTVAVAGEEIALCDGRTGGLLRRLDAGKGSRIEDIAFRSDGGLTLVLKTPRGTVIRRGTLDLGTWDEVPMDAMGGQVRLDASAGEDVVLSGFQSNTIRLWALPPRELRSIDLGADAGYTRLAVSGDGSRIVTLTQPTLSPDHPSLREKRSLTEAELRLLYQSRIRIWDCRELPPVSQVAELPGGLVARALALSRDGNALAVGSYASDTAGGAAAQVLLGSFSPVGTLVFRTLGSQESDVLTLAFTPDGKQLVTGSAMRRGSAAAELACWNLVTGSSWTARYPTTVSALAVSPDGERIAIGGIDETVRLRSLAEPALDASVVVIGERISAFAFSHSGSQLAVATPSGRVLVFGVVGTRLNHKAEADLDHAGSYVSALAFDPQKPVLYSGTASGSQGVCCWDTSVWKRIGPIVPFAGGVTDLGLASGRPGVLAVANRGRLIMRVIPTDD
jgi:WD40 repeat protein